MGGIEGLYSRSESPLAEGEKGLLVHETGDDHGRDHGKKLGWDGVYVPGAAKLDVDMCKDSYMLVVQTWLHNWQPASVYARKNEEIADGAAIRLTLVDAVEQPSFAHITVYSAFREVQLRTPPLENPTKGTKYGRALFFSVLRGSARLGDQTSGQTFGCFESFALLPGHPTAESVTIEQGSNLIVADAIVDKEEGDYGDFTEMHLLGLLGKGLFVTVE